MVSMELFFWANREVRGWWDELQPPWMQWDPGLPLGSSLPSSPLPSQLPSLRTVISADICGFPDGVNQTCFPEETRAPGNPTFLDRGYCLSLIPVAITEG